MRLNRPTEDMVMTMILSWQMGNEGDGSMDMRTPARSRKKSDASV